MVFHEFSWIVTWMKTSCSPGLHRCHARDEKTRGIMSLICFVFSDVLDVSSCRSETPSLIEEFRGRVSKIDVDFRDVKGVWF